MDVDEAAMIASAIEASLDDAIDSSDISISSSFASTSTSTSVSASRSARSKQARLKKAAKMAEASSIELDKLACARLDGYNLRCAIIASTDENKLFANIISFERDRASRAHCSAIVIDLLHSHPPTFCFLVDFITKALSVNFSRHPDAVCLVKDSDVIKWSAFEQVIYIRSWTTTYGELLDFLLAHLDNYPADAHHFAVITHIASVSSRDEKCVLPYAGTTCGSTSRTLRHRTIVVTS